MLKGSIRIFSNAKRYKSDLFVEYILAHFSSLLGHKRSEMNHSIGKIIMSRIC